MILILSNALAKRWRLKPVPLTQASPCHPALVWRTDWFLVGSSRSNIICVNEESMFSFVLIGLNRMSFKSTMQSLINRIGDSLFQAGVPEYHIRLGTSDIQIAKHTDRRIIGTICDQKIQYECHILREPHPGIRNINDVEDCVNKCPTTILDFKYPSEVFADTVKKTWPTNGSSLLDGVPSDKS